MKVLVTGAGALLGQGIIRSLQKSELSPEIIAVDPSALSAGLYWADSSHLVHTAKSENYIQSVEAIIECERPDVILIGTDVELEVFAEHRMRLERQWSLQVVVSDPLSISIANDKFLTYEFLKHAGFNPPESSLPENAKKLVDIVGFPLVVKPRIGARSYGLEVVQNDEELEKALSKSKGLIVQEYVDGSESEFTAGTLTFDGICEASVVFRRDLRDGNTYRAFTHKDPDTDQQIRDMAEAFGAHGPANFQFRLKDGVARVFEINCRFSGTTPLRALAGFNEVDLVLRHLCCGQRVVQPSIEDLVFLRHWEETAVAPDDLVR